MTAVIFLIVHLTTYPLMPGIVVGAYETETACIKAAEAHGLRYQASMQFNAPRIRWACEVRT